MNFKDVSIRTFVRLLNRLIGFSTVVSWNCHSKAAFGTHLYQLIHNCCWEGIWCYKYQCLTSLKITTTTQLYPSLFKTFYYTYRLNLGQLLQQIKKIAKLTINSNRIISLLPPYCANGNTLLSQLYDAAFNCCGGSVIPIEEKEMKMNTKMGFTAYELCLRRKIES